MPSKEFRIPDRPQLPPQAAGLAPQLTAAAVDAHFTHHLEIWQRLHRAVDDVQRASDLAAHYAHQLYWQTLTPSEGRQASPGAELLQDITAAHGSLDGLLATIADQAHRMTGNGWVMLARDGVTGALVVAAIEGEGLGGGPGLHPLLLLDLWEHAYYLQYRFRRSAYVIAWWQLIDWAVVQRRDGAARRRSLSSS